MQQKTWLVSVKRKKCKAEATRQSGCSKSRRVHSIVGGGKTCGKPMDISSDRGVSDQLSPPMEDSTANRTRLSRAFAT